MLVPVLVALEMLAVGEDCPAGADVEMRVRAILHLAPERTLSESFLVERHEAGLHVELRGEDAALIGQRTLPIEGSCDELAQAAAVVLSAWLSDVHPDFAAALPLPSPELAPPEPAPPEPAPAPAPKAKTKPRPPPRERTAAALEPSEAPGSFEAALGIGADFTSGIIAPSAALQSGYGAEGSGLAITALLVATTPRSEPLEPGSIRWWRWPLGIGLSWRFRAPLLWGELGGGPLVSWFHAEGQAFDRNTSQDAAQWGGFVSAAVSGRARPLSPFALAVLQIYPGRSTAYVENLARDWPLPTWGVGFAVGGRFRR